MDCLHNASPYHWALVLRGLSKHQEEEEEVKPELIQVMEYAEAIGAIALEQVMDIDWQAIIAVEGLDLTVTDLKLRVQEVERKQGNEHGIQGALAETWGRTMNCQDAVDQMEVDVEGIINRVDRAENALLEVDKQVVRLEWELANAQRDVVMLVAEQMRMADNWEHLQAVVLDQTVLIINERAVVTQHRLENLIVMDDREDNERDDEYFQPPLAVILVENKEGVLWEIDEEEDRDGLPEYEE